KLFGRYVLKRQLGAGGMGAVWLARDEKLDRVVALKFLSGELLDQPVAIERLKRETKHSLSLTHPNIVRIYDFVQGESHAAIAMECVEGWSLWAMKVDKPNRCFTVEEITPWIQQLCSAVDYAHSVVGIVHRDIKPANLLVDQRGQLKITDFGLARNLAATPSAQTTQMPIVGTIGYMSPQQASGAEASVLDDIYAIGATIYDLLTGTPPFYKGEVYAQLRESTSPPMVERLHELGIQGVEIPLPWEETVAACLEKETARRPKSAAEVARRLFARRTRPPPPDPPPVATSETVRPPAQRNLLAYALLLLALVIAASAAYVGSQLMRSRSALTGASAATPVPVLATTIYAAVDDFIVDIYHNGQKVADEKRQLINNVFGAVAEKTDVTVREGDWLVFNVVNNRLRWNGAYYFAVAGMTESNTIAFATDLTNGRWSVCDDPTEAARFIAKAEHLAINPPKPIDRPWHYGDTLMTSMAKGWQGQPIWGTNRNTWIKFRAARKADGS
ncbi:MAG TPA: serine/threonine-protein kinase, partial [Candidatus Binatia bacterium]|nr:serine/threonine-protein kinase [Candidatus Binatia bacterium]